MTNEIEIPVRHIEVDALFIANGAEVKDGLIYVLGGGWTRCWPLSGQSYPYDRAVALNAIVRVPWSETNTEHSFALRVRTGEGTVVSPLVEGAFSMGRPADIHQGMSQVVPLAVTLPVKLEGPGIYHAELLIDGEVKKVIEFEALDRPPQN